MNSPFAKICSCRTGRRANARFSLCLRVLIYLNTVFFSLGQVFGQEFRKELTIQSRVFLPTKGTATGVAWSPDGEKLAAISDFGGKITVWNSQGASIGQFERNGTYVENSLAFLADNKTLLIPPSLTKADDKKYSFSLLNTQNGQFERLVRGPSDENNNAAYKFAISPNRKYVANVVSDFNRPVIIYSTTSWDIFRSLQSNLPHHYPTSTAFSSDAKTLAIGRGGGAIDLLDLENVDAAAQRSIEAYRPEDLSGVGALAFNPNGRLLAAGAGVSLSTPTPQSDAQIEARAALKVWDFDLSRFIFLDAKLAPPVHSLSWSADGRYLAVAAADRAVHMYSVLGSDPNKLSLVIKFAEPVGSAVFSPASYRLAIASGSGVSVFVISQPR